MSQINTTRSVCLSVNSANFCRVLMHSLWLSIVQTKQVWNVKMSCVLKCRFAKQSLWWYQLDLCKSQFYNSWSCWAVFSNEHGEWKDWLMERSCILWGTVERYIGGHLGILVYQPLCWPMHSQLSTDWIGQREDRVQSFEHRVSTYFWAVLWVRVGFHLNFQVKFICLFFLPSSLPSIIELCSFCHGWKDLFLLHKLDGNVVLDH